MTAQILTVRRLGLCDYPRTVTAMRAFTERRDHDTPDEIWLLEHPPVFTLGRAAQASHILDAGAIPVVRTDRGGQVTYHGPGQLVAYPLVDLQRRGLGVKPFVHLLEDALIDVLADFGISAARRAGAPGVYVDGKKIGALGLRVRRGCSYHGVSLNVAMDLAPFGRIDPCGFPGLDVVQMAELAVIPITGLQPVANALVATLTRRLGYDRIQLIDAPPEHPPPAAASTGKDPHFIDKGIHGDLPIS